MTTAQPSLFEFSDGSRMTIKPIELSDTAREFVKLTQDIDKLITSAATIPVAMGAPSQRCPYLSKGVHNPIKLNTKRHPDQTYWCSGCGLTNLQAPERKSWE